MRSVVWMVGEVWVFDTVGIDLKGGDRCDWSVLDIMGSSDRRFWSSGVVLIMGFAIWGSRMEGWFNMI